MENVEIYSQRTYSSTAARSNKAEKGSYFSALSYHTSMMLKIYSFHVISYKTVNCERTNIKVVLSAVARNSMLKYEMPRKITFRLEKNSF